MTTRKSITQVLAYAGLIPFIAAVILAWVGGHVLGQSPVFLFVSYSAIILSFLGGILWGRVIDQPLEPFAVRFLLLSNVFSLLAWLGLLLAHLLVALPILLLGYLALLVIELRDRHLLYSGAPEHYLSMRVVLTTVVVMLHAVLIAIVMGVAG